MQQVSASIATSSLASLPLPRHSPPAKLHPKLSSRGGCATRLWNRRLEQQSSRWRCAAEPDPPQPSSASVGNEADAPAEGGSPDPDSSSSSLPVESYSDGPGRNGNRALALASCAIAVGLFLAPRLISTGPGLGELAAMAVPYEQALGNGRPTILEFYADWCEVCREMTSDVYAVEKEYRDKVNFVMLNVDNTKWEEELDEFGVEGIPHFSFLDGQGNEQGAIVGRLPRRFLQENVDALAKGESVIPHSRAVGRFSGADSRKAPPLVEPRSHSSS